MAIDPELVSQCAVKPPLAHPRAGTPRIPWLDNLKAIGIYLVLAGHMSPASPLTCYYGPFVNPLFFFVSGCSFDRGKYSFRQFLRRKIRTIVIPYLVFATISFLFWLLVVRNLSIRGQARAIDPSKALIGVLYGVNSGEWKLPMNAALWFLPCLFVVEMVFYFVRNRLLLVVFAILGCLAAFLPFRLPWSADVALIGIVYYGLGYFYKDARVSHKTLALLAALHLGSWLLCRGPDLANLAYRDILCLSITPVFAVMLYSALFRFTKTNRVLEYVAANTIIILGLADIPWFVARGVAYILSGSALPQSGDAAALVASAANICLTAPAIYCINRWFPFILGRPWHRTVGNRDT